MPPADPSKPRLPRDCYYLSIRQGPSVGKAVGSKVSDRKPVDPPPIIRLQIKDLTDPAQNYLQSPYYMCVGTLWDPEDDRSAKVSGDQPALAGTLVSSLHKLKDVNNEDAGFFVFGDLSVRPEGEFRIRFVLYELLEGEAVFLSSILSSRFKVHSAKTFPGLKESTFISRSFGDQGVRLRIRKDARSANKRNAKSQNIGEEGGYESKSQSNTTPTSQQSSTAYGDAQGYAPRGYTTDQNLVKRQRTSHDFTQAAFDRDNWQYSSAPNSAGLYTPSSGYSQEVVPASQQLAYGSFPRQGHLAQASSAMYARGQSGDYRYDMGASYAAQSDPSGGLSQYSDGHSYSGSHGADPNSEMSPASHHSSNQYAGFGDTGLRQSLAMRGTSNPQGSNVLPLPFNNNALSSPGASSITAATYNYSTTDNRYPTQAGTQSSMRHPGYPGYQGYQVQTPFPST